MSQKQNTKDNTSPYGPEIKFKAKLRIKEKQKEKQMQKAQMKNSSNIILHAQSQS